MLVTASNCSNQKCGVRTNGGPIILLQQVHGHHNVLAMVFVFFALAFLSVYTRQCLERRGRLRARLPISIPTGDHTMRPSRSAGDLDEQLIRTFPTSVYSSIKGLKIGRTTLECAVCLNEFQEDETLRFIPKCNHVFHPHCIDLWLSSHSTCPVCQANLGDMPLVAFQEDEPDSECRNTNS